MINRNKLRERREKMKQKEYLVTGATGKTGRRVVSQLRERGASVRAASRSSATRFDWQDPSSWQAALAGTEGVYLVVPDDPELIKSFVWAMENADVAKVVLLSARAVGKEHVFAQAMLAAEQAVKQSSLDWTILRPNNFMQNFDEDLWQPAIKAGRLGLPTAGLPEPFIDTEDIAAVAATALLEDGHGSRTYELSGREAITWAEATEAMAEAAGHPVDFEELSPEAYLQEVAEEGYDSDSIAVVDSLFAALRTGKSAPVSTAVQVILGREPISFRDFARKAAAAGAWS